MRQDDNTHYSNTGSLDTSLHCTLYPGPLSGQTQGGHRDAALRPGDSADDSRHQHQVSLGIRLRPGTFRGKYMYYSNLRLLTLVLTKIFMRQEILMGMEWYFAVSKCILISARGLDV